MTVTQIPSANDTLHVVADFPGCTPDVLFDYWVKPDLIQQWWSPKAEIDARLGGNYQLSWPEPDWHLYGHYTSFELAKKLAFTWQWDHYPSLEEVVVIFEPVGERGTRMTITHGPYADTKQGQQDRQGHLDGWEHFITKLQSLIKC